jgi:hypothetical protein
MILAFFISMMKKGRRRAAPPLLIVVWKKCERIPVAISKFEFRNLDEHIVFTPPEAQVRFTSRGNHYSQERMRFFLCNH